MKDKTLFISDLHLDPNQPAITNTFYYFLDHIALDAKALYILGDFFESYVGDDDRDQYTQLIKHALKRVTGLGLPIFLMHGNRDFLMGEKFESETGVKFISDPTIISLNKQRILLMHGDSLCTDYKSHQRFRKIIHNRWVQKLFLLLPLSFRQKIAAQLRQESRKYNQTKSAEIMDVNQTAINKALIHHHATLLIHGHTHRPMMSDKRIVLDAWHEHGHYLQIDSSGKWEAITIPH